MKIAIDGTPIVHGSRAISRHGKNLLQTIACLNADHEYKVLYLDRRKQRQRYVSFPERCRAQEYIVSIPGRIIHQGWKYLAIPKAEWLMGDFDIFYATDLYFPPAARGIVLATIHGLAYHVIEDKLLPNETAVLKKGLTYSLKHADYLLAVSETTRDELIQYLGVPEERIYIVSHGVDPHFRILKDRENLRGRLKSKFGISQPYLLFVGVIGHHKNVIGLLESYALLRELGVKLPLLLAGPPGSAWSEAQAWIAGKSQEDNILTVGQISQDNGDLRDLYNGAALFVFPSFYEGWTAPPIEAMACGTPVVTSNCSSIPETVGDAALKVNPNNPDELAHEIKRVLNDNKLRKQLIDKGLRHVQLHTWENAATKMMGVFTAVHKRGPWKNRKK